MYSRMFGQVVTERDEMAHVLAQYASMAARRLRAHGLLASLVTTSISTSEFRTPAWHHTRSAALSPPTSEPADIIAATRAVLPLMQPGRPYNRAGVLLSGPTPADAATPLYAEPAPAVGPAIDRIHRRYGQTAIGFGHSGLQQARRWDMRREHLSQAYTTRWEDLPSLRT